MTNGKIWEIVFFNFNDWESIKKMDRKSNILKTISRIKKLKNILITNALLGSLMLIPTKIK
jgi:hypothetical protein